MLKVVVTRRWPKLVEEELCDLYDVQLNSDDRPFSQRQMQAALHHADVLCPTVTDDLSAKVLNGKGRTKLLANFGVGFNHIDMQAARDVGMAVSNTPDVLTDATADLTLMLMLMTSRRVYEGQREVRERTWSGWRPTHLLGQQMTGKTLGIVGFGRIGQAVAQRAAAGFGMRVLVYNHRPLTADPKGALANVGAKQVDELASLLPQVDFLSIHCPSNAKTKGLLDSQNLGLLPAHAILINTARGDIVDEPALIAALKSRQLWAAGLDVYPKEPEVNPALLALDNAILLPHLGSATEKTRVAMGRRVLQNIAAFAAGEPLLDGLL